MNPLVIAGVVWREMLRRKDYYVLLILLAAMTVYLLSVDTFGVVAAERYVLDIGLVMIWLFSIVLAVTLTARQIPNEERKGTIYALMAKPLSRLEFLIGKFLGSWLAVCWASLSFYGFLIMVVYLRGGQVQWVALAQNWMLFAIMLGVVSAITLLLSTRLTCGAATTLSFVAQWTIFALVPRIPVLIGYEQGLRRTLMLVIYYLLPHYEVFDMRRRVVHGWGAIPLTLLLTISLYGMALIVVFLTLAWFAYRRKTFMRGSA